MPVTEPEAVVKKTVAAAAELPEDGFIPLAALRTAFRFWWFIFLLAAVGGFAGWLAHRAQPPVYEAVGHFSTTIDYVATGPMTQFEEDTAINVVGDVINSVNVVQAVVDQAAAEGIQTSVVDLKKAAVLERRVNVWDLRVRNADPRVAERLANLWVEQGQKVLLEAYQHALQADRWDRYLQSLENCLAKAASSEPGSGQCSKGRFAEIQGDLQSAGSQYAQERIASLGLFSGLVIGPVDRALATPGPVIFQRSQMVLAGCFIGLLLGIGLLQLGIPGRWMTGRPGAGKPKTKRGRS